MTVHDFNDSLAYSHSQADQPWWEQVYRRAFVDFAAMVDLRKDGWHQRAGRDRTVVLTSGRAVYVDEKVRTDHWNDILVEVWSVYPSTGRQPYPQVDGAKPGWAREPKDCDWLAYAFVPTRTCHLFPFLGIRVAAQKFGAEWRDKADAKRGGYRWVESHNRGYKTVSVAVPTGDLRAAIADAMTVTWAGDP